VGRLSAIRSTWNLLKKTTHHIQTKQGVTCAVRINEKTCVISTRNVRGSPARVVANLGWGKERIFAGWEMKSLTLVGGPCWKSCCSTYSHDASFCRPDSLRERACLSFRNALRIRAYSSGFRHWFVFWEWLWLRTYVSAWGMGLSSEMR